MVEPSERIDFYQLLVHPVFKRFHVSEKNEEDFMKTEINYYQSEKYLNLVDHEADFGNEDEADFMVKSLDND